MAMGLCEGYNNQAFSRAAVAAKVGFFLLHN